MTNIILAIISLSILGYHAYYVHESNKEKRSLVDAIIAKSAQELRDLRLAQNTKIKVEPPKESPFVPLENLDDEALLKAEGIYE